MKEKHFGTTIPTFARGEIDSTGGSPLHYIKSGLEPRSIGTVG